LVEQRIYRSTDQCLLLARSQIAGCKDALASADLRKCSDSITP
jgi:hypothetical protein